ncbi:MAG: endonuclease/exonuclease/phosphatase family protein [Ktedonobacteraceae bacterium]
MTRVVSYNILAGGYNIRARGRRTEALAQVIQSARPDIVGLPEAIHPQAFKRPTIVEELAERLGMQFVTGDDNGPVHYRYDSEFKVGLLTRLPIIRTRVHTRPGILTRPLLEVCVEDHGEPLTVFVAHLVASFSQRRASDLTRRREVREILNIMVPLQGQPHLLMGDFNAIAPGDQLKASALLRYVVRLDQEQVNSNPADGHPHLSYVIPEGLHMFNPLLRLVPRSRLLMKFVDVAAGIYAPRTSIGLVRGAGYVDCFRSLHPAEQGFTCPAAAPAGRIDFIFASPEMAQRLAACSVIASCEGLDVHTASDHLAVTAEFGQRVGASLEDSQRVGAYQV